MSSASEDFKTLSVFDSTREGFSEAENGEDERLGEEAVCLSSQFGLVELEGPVETSAVLCLLRRLD